MWTPEWGLICRHLFLAELRKAWQEKNREGAKKGTVYRRKRWINKCKIMNANTWAMYLFREDQEIMRWLGFLQELGCWSGVTSGTAGSNTCLSHQCLLSPGLACDLLARKQTVHSSNSVLLPLLSCDIWYILLGCDPTSPLSNGSAPTLSCMLVPCSFLRRGPNRINNFKAQFMYQSWKVAGHS